MAGSVLGSIAGGAASGLVGGIFGDKASDQAAAGAQASQQIFTPKPFRASSTFFDVRPNGTAQLTQFGKNRHAQLLRNSNRAFDRFDKFDRGAFADRLLEASNRINDDRENQAFTSLESKLFNSAGASTGTQRQIADFQSDIEDRRFSRALQAQIGADEFARARYGDFTNAFSQLGNFDDRRQNIQGLSLDGGRAQLPTTANNPGAAQAGLWQAQNTQNYGNSLGALVGGGVQAGFDYFNSPAASYTPFNLGNPFTYTPSNPFTGVGPLSSFGN